MAVPQQIRDQSAAADKFYADLALEQDAEPTAADDTKAKADAKAADAKVAAPEPADKGTIPASEHGRDSEGIQHKYDTLQGIHTAQMRQKQADIEALNDRVRGMEQLLANPVYAAKPAGQENSQPLVTEAEIEEYGSETVDMLRRVSREETRVLAAKVDNIEAAVRQFMNNVNTSVVPQMQQVARSQTQSQDQSFKNELSTMVPNWKSINDNNGFKSWLLAVDPMMGVTRQSALEAAHKQFDTSRVASFFTTWAALNGTDTNVDALADKSQKAAGSELERQIAPGRSRSAAAPSNDQAKVYTPEDIAKFYDDVRKGKYTSRKDERAAIERDIFTNQARAAAR